MTHTISRPPTSQEFAELVDNISLATAWENPDDNIAVAAELKQAEIRVYENCWLLPDELPLRKFVQIAYPNGCLEMWRYTETLGWH